LRRDVERIANIQVVLERAPLVRVETSALGQVVLNLVLNAAQAIEGSGLKGKTIRIVVESQGETAVLSVSDDGPGISKENLERIFEPYFTTKSTGTGLGLSIVREMVRRVGGQISVLSQPNHETTFRVLLPSAPSTA
jgi:signal transduction histidine kinase